MEAVITSYMYLRYLLGEGRVKSASIGVTTCVRVRERESVCGWVRGCENMVVGMRMRIWGRRKLYLTDVVGDSLKVLANDQSHDV